MPQSTGFLGETAFTVTRSDLCTAAEKVASMIADELFEGAMATRYGLRAIVPEELWSDLDQLTVGSLMIQMKLSNLDATTTFRQLVNLDYSFETN